MSEENKKCKQKKSPRWLRPLLISLGMLSLCLGIIGIIVPVLPTTPFVLLSAALFARSSDRFYCFLIGNRFFGRIIRDYRDGKGVPLKVKSWAIVVLWLTITASIVFAVDILWVRILLVVIAIAVTIHISTIKGRKK